MPCDRVCDGGVDVVEAVQQPLTRHRDALPSPGEEMPQRFLGVVRLVRGRRSSTSARTASKGLRVRPVCPSAVTKSSRAVMRRRRPLRCSSKSRSSASTSDSARSMARPSHSTIGGSAWPSPSDRCTAARRTPSAAASWVDLLITTIIWWSLPRSWATCRKCFSVTSSNRPTVSTNRTRSAPLTALSRARRAGRARHRLRECRRGECCSSGTPLPRPLRHPRRSRWPGRLRRQEWPEHRGRDAAHDLGFLPRVGDSGPQPPTSSRDLPTCAMRRFRVNASRLTPYVGSTSRWRCSTHG